jgi:hypothetical protein
MTERSVAMKTSEELMYSVTWKNLEDIMPSERTQTQKATQCMIPFM